MIQAQVLGVDVRFWTEDGLFSPMALDAGTLAMLGQVRFAAEDKVLDLGCGYGLVGVVAAKLIGPERVTMADIDPLAVATARRNLELNGVEGVTCVESDGFRGLAETGFTKILINPPYHVDFSIPKHMIEKGFNRLAIGGAMWMVTKRDAWYRNRLGAVFGGARMTEIDGYFVFEALKRQASYAQRSRR